MFRKKKELEKYGLEVQLKFLQGVLGGVANRIRLGIRQKQRERRGTLIEVKALDVRGESDQQHRG